MHYSALLFKYIFVICWTAYWLFGFAEWSTMGKSKQKGNHNNGRKKNIAKTWKTKRRTKDLDQIHSDMKPEIAAKLLHQEVDYDVTGCAQHYCLHCA